MPCLLAAGGMLAKKKTAGIVSDDLRSVVHNGGDEGDRTPDLLNAIQALSHLSYGPTGGPGCLSAARVRSPIGKGA